MCMTEDPFGYQVLNLTNQFYMDYPSPPYKEIARIYKFSTLQYFHHELGITKYSGNAID